MSGNPLVRFDEGRVGRTSVSPSLLLYRLCVLLLHPFDLAEQLFQSDTSRISPKITHKFC